MTSLPSPPRVANLPLPDSLKPHNNGYSHEDTAAAHERFSSFTEVIDPRRLVLWVPRKIRPAAGGGDSFPEAVYRDLPR